MIQNLIKIPIFLWLLPILMFVVGGAIIFKLFIIKKKLSIFIYEI
jgi:cytochrome c-type biogenesis protein CcmH/NrfF